MDGWADGLNFYLATHPAVRPKVLTHFEPWMALSFTEGSIGGDIEKINLKALQAFYDRPTPPSHTAAAPSADEVAQLDRYREPTGSNGIAIAPKNTTAGHALLLINPHTSFYFRSELQMSSDEGLNVYGAATWGQPFVYQGFNQQVGFMHTTSGVDAIDEFAETIAHTVLPADRYYARVEGGPLGPVLHPLQTSRVTLRFRQPDGGFGERTFVTYRTAHGPIVREEGGKWIAFSMMYRPVEALSQSWLAHQDARGGGLSSRGGSLQGELIEQHASGRRPGPHRLPAPAVHPQARRSLRLPPAGRWLEPRHGLEGRHPVRGDPAPDRSALGVRLQLQRRALECGRAGEPEKDGVP